MSLTWFDVLMVGIVSAPVILFLCYLIFRAVELFNKDETTRD